MSKKEWVNGFYGGIVVCDEQGIIIEMNDYSEKTFAEQGGRSLIGSSLFNCHNETSIQKIQAILETQQPNIYIVEKDGEKKMILQAPWYKEHKLAGLVEITMPIAGEIPAVKR